MNEILDKIQFLIKKKPAVIITGEGRALAKQEEQNQKG
jgi:hypothetical protein